MHIYFLKFSHRLTRIEVISDESNGNIDLKLANTTKIENIDINPQDQPMHGGGHKLDDEMNIVQQENEPFQARRALNAKFILKTKETNMLTQKSVDNIVEDWTDLVRGTVKALKSGLKDCSRTMLGLIMMQFQK